MAMKNLTMSVTGNGSFEEEYEVAMFRCFMFTNSVALKMLMVTGYCVTVATSTIGNSILASIYFKNKSMRNAVNSCIMNMVFADLLVTLVYMPRMIARVVVGVQWLADGNFGLALCIIVSLSQEISICVPILTVIIIAFERFFAVAFPLREVVSRRVSIALLSGTWLISLGARSPMIYAVKIIRVSSGELTCLWIHGLSFPSEVGRKFYHGFMLITFYGVPLFCIMALYTTIFIFLKRRKAFIDNATRNRALAVNKKVTKMMLAVITAFLFCWLLYFILLPLGEFFNVSVSCEVYFLSIFLRHVNSACNPVICIVFSENYRKDAKSTCFGRFLRWQSSRKYVLRHGSDTSRDRSISNIEILSMTTLDMDASKY